MDDVLYFIMEYHKKFHEYPSVETIVEECGGTKVSVRKAIAELKQEGYLEKSLYVKKTKKQKAQ